MENPTLYRENLDALRDLYDVPHELWSLSKFIEVGVLAPVDPDIEAARTEMERLFRPPVPLRWARMVLIAAGVIDDE